MFLCEPCHTTSGCQWDTVFELPSHGRCEACDEVRICTDCHGY